MSDNENETIINATPSEEDNHIYEPITRPLDESEPTQHEIEETSKIIELLAREGCIPSDTEETLRKEALKYIELHLVNFVTKMALNMKLKLKQEMINNNGSKVYPFGSYSLGAYNAESDIDVLCVVPKYILKSHFFILFVKYLKGRRDITNVNPLTTAYVPVIKIEYKTVHLDLLFASTNHVQIPYDLDLVNMNLDLLCNPEYTKSVNGPRVSMLITKLIPNISTFQTALRFIKLWATRKGLNSNVMGYFGGIAWAISVARACQLYPKASASRIIYQYFELMAQWLWPHPILLTDIKKDAHGNVLSGNWDPINNGTDQAHRMPIITPAHPTMCCTHNVTRSNQIILMFEMFHAFELCQQVIMGQAKWADIVTPIPFFDLYPAFIQVSACTFDKQAHSDFSGDLESRIRRFSDELDLDEQLTFVHINPNPFEVEHKCLNEQQVNLVQQGDDNIAIINSNAPLEKVYKTIYTTSYFIGLAIDETKQDIKQIIENMQVERLFKEAHPEFNLKNEDKWIMFNKLYRNQIPVEFKNQMHSYNIPISNNKVIKRTLQSQQEDSNPTKLVKAT